MKHFHCTVCLSWPALCVHLSDTWHPQYHNQTPSHLKDLIILYHPTGALCSQTAGLLVDREYLKVEWEVEPSVVRPLFYGSRFQFGFRRPTPSLLLCFSKEESFKPIVRVGADGHEPSLNSAGKGIGWWGLPMMLWMFLYDWLCVYTQCCI